MSVAIWGYNSYQAQIATDVSLSAVKTGSTVDIIQQLSVPLIVFLCDVKDLPVTSSYEILQL
jgi:hypothetical protein